MSRHRSVRRLDLDDYYDEEEDYGDEDEYGFDDYEDEDPQVAYDPHEHKASVSSSIRLQVDQVRQVVGDSHTVEEIKQALVSHNHSVERTIDYLLSDAAEPAAAAPPPRQAASAPAKGKQQPQQQQQQARQQQAQAPQQHKGKQQAAKTSAATSANLDQVAADMDALGFKAKARPDAGSRGSLNLPPPAVAAIRSEGSLASLSAGVSRAGSTTSIKSSPKWKRVNIQEEFQKRSAGKSRINLVVVGHVDAGKSTMMGHLLVILGEVSERTIKKYERDAEKMKKGSFAFAWVLDETEDERSRGVTIDVAVSKFETPKHSFTLLDAPGHRDFIPNMISGASQADVAILVVDSIQGEFEAGFDNGGQTREHAILLRSLGVSQLIVAINKLDAMSWSKQRFEDVQAKLLSFLIQVGFKKQRVTFVPCSGFTGENLMERKVKELTAWYSGPTLVEALDSFEAPTRPIDRPLRLSIQDLFKGGIGAGGSGDVTVSGRIEMGGVQLGDAVLAIPIGEVGQVRAIEVGGESATWAAAGDQVSITLNGLDTQQLSTGDILCDASAPIPVTTHFRAQIVTLEIAMPLTIGVPVVIHHLGRTEAGFLERLESQLDKATGQVTKKNPRALPKHTTAIVQVRTQRPMCLDAFQNAREVGRFMLRSGAATVAAGIVVDILSFERVGGAASGLGSRSSVARAEADARQLLADSAVAVSASSDEVDENLESVVHAPAPFAAAVRLRFRPFEEKLLREPPFPLVEDVDAPDPSAAPGGGEEAAVVDEDGDSEETDDLEGGREGGDDPMVTEPTRIAIAPPDAAPTGAPALASLSSTLPMRPAPVPAAGGLASLASLSAAAKPFSAGAALGLLAPGNQPLRPNTLQAPAVRPPPASLASLSSLSSPSSPGSGLAGSGGLAALATPRPSQPIASALRPTPAVGSQGSGLAGLSSLQSLSALAKSSQPKPLGSGLAGLAGLSQIQAPGSLAPRIPIGPASLASLAPKATAALAVAPDGTSVLAQPTTGCTEHKHAVGSGSARNAARKQRAPHAPAAARNATKEHSMFAQPSALAGLFAAHQARSAPTAPAEPGMLLALSRDIAAASTGAFLFDKPSPDDVVRQARARVPSRRVAQPATVDGIADGMEDLGV
ncbi:hypothetical protein HK105_205703 [Polyrhizophydium stewartii]|uniref:Tr-type G domain-containing protein n=1 Tax=Polyrhizophydium stewartii TaxID=2732419 RepID=A0ABR4N5F3_9FUNG